MFDNFVWAENWRDLSLYGVFAICNIASVYWATSYERFKRRMLQVDLELERNRLAVQKTLTRSCEREIEYKQLLLDIRDHELRLCTCNQRVQAAALINRGDGRKKDN